MKYRLLTGLLLALAFSCPVFAETPDHFYIKANLGSSTFSSIDLPAGAVVSSRETVGDAWAVAAGLELGEFLGFELGHHDFGKSSARYVVDGVAQSYELSLSSNALSIVPSLPLGDKTRFFMQLGEHVWDSDLAFSNGADLPSDGSDFFYVFGFTYDFNDNLRTGFEHGRFDFDTEDLELLSVSLTYRFSSK